jgi:N-acetylglutamate synthase-like GNAT family acetyltransferase
MYTFLLRQAVLTDAVAITELTRAAYAGYIPLIGREPLPMRVDYDLALQSNVFWLLEQEQELVALLELKLEADHLLIVNVAVKPLFQGFGLGKRLLLLAESEARRLERFELQLYTNERFTKNIAIYQGLGFQETHRQKPPESDTDTVYMKKLLV